MRCAVPNCRNSFVTRAKRDPGQKKPQIGFFSFPKCPETFKLWLAFCGTESALKVKNPFICTEHFKEEDIEGSLQFEMGLAKKRTLRPGAVPCVNKNPESPSERDCRERTQRRRNKRLVDELLAEDEAKASSTNEVVPTPDYVRLTTGIASAPAFVSPPRGGCDLDEGPLPENDPLVQQGRLQLRIKCRICYQDFDRDSMEKDLFDEAHSILLFHIEVISGVWISQIQGEPHHMCLKCQTSLRQAIEFRELCISTELKLNQIKPECMIEEDESAGEVQEEAQEESLPSDAELSSDSEFTTVEDVEVIEVAQEEPPESDSSATDTQLDQEATEEASDPAIEDPLSVALGAKIFKDLINQYTGQQRGKSTTKKENPLPKKPSPKPRKTAVREQKPKRRANPKTKEERNRIRRAQLRAKPPNFVCDQCGQAFRMSHNLRMHQLRHTRTKNYECSECSMTFYDAYMRNIHIRIRHRGETPYGCRHCSETFAYAGARQKHESEVHGAPPRLIVQRINPKPMPRTEMRHHCKLCHKHYASKYALRWHVKTHAEYGGFQCQQCEKSYADPGKLKRHELTHEKRPLQCDVCLKGFYQRTRLKEHELIHTGERPYWCELCDVHFRYKYNLKTHANSKVHQDNLSKQPDVEFVFE
ncbi:hypothetical protein KR009_008866 [Drosophila setifemur]|nr:hypothetical protein KR009_008866 [Drosophila setifemur]